MSDQEEFEKAWEDSSIDSHDKDERTKHLEMVIKKINDDYWFMINLIERYSSNKEDTLKDVLERIKFRKPLMEKALTKE
jgi:phage pi2 protein 07